MADALPTDIRDMSDQELALYLSRSLAALEFSASFDERHQLAHWVIKLQLEQEARRRKVGESSVTPKEVAKLAADLLSDALKKR